MRIITETKMKLIKQLNEMADQLMDQETFERLVKFAVEDIEKLTLGGKAEASDDEKLEIIHSMIENVAGYEEADVAAELANRVLARVNELTQ
jgi:hypothetical protein